MNELFLDTSYLIAVETASERNHNEARRHWLDLLRSGLPRLVTTSYVFDETVTFFNSRGHHAKAVEVGRRLIKSRQVDLVHVDELLFLEGWSYFQRRPDKGYSLTDCISFVLMGKKEIRRALSFDRHFEQAGFVNEP